jgi:hypothetical protein
VRKKKGQKGTSEDDHDFLMGPTEKKQPRMDLLADEDDILAVAPSAPDRTMGSRRRPSTSSRMTTSSSSQSSHRSYQDYPVKKRSSAPADGVLATGGSPDRKNESKFISLLCSVRRDPVYQLVDIVEPVTADRIVQFAEIRYQGIWINSRGVRRRKTGGIEKKIAADIVEFADDSPWAPVTVHRFSKIKSNSSISISCSSAWFPFVVVFIFVCPRAQSDR